MRTAKRQSVLVPTTLPLIFGIVIGAVGITIIQQPAASHPAPGAMASTSGKRAPSDQPVNDAGHAVGATEQPQARKEPAEQQVAPDDAPEPQPQAQEEEKPAKQPSGKPALGAARILLLSQMWSTARRQCAAITRPAHGTRRAAVVRA